MMLYAALVFTALFVFSHSEPTGRAMHVFEFRANPPSGFSYSGTAPPGSTLNLRLALVGRDIPGLHKAVYDVSTPSSPAYGQYLSKEELKEFVAPTPESVAAVTSWLSEHGVNATAITPAGDWLAFSVTVDKAAEMLDTEFSVFSHQETGKTMIRTLAYSIPADLKDHVDLIHPTTSFLVAKSSDPVFHGVVPSRVIRDTAAASGTTPAACASPTPIRPACLQELYGVPTTLATQSQSNSLGVVGYNNNPSNTDDLHSFLMKFRSDMNPNTTFTLRSVDGGYNTQNVSLASPESNFDTQYAIGLSSGVPVDFISVGEEEGHDAWLDTATYLINAASPPHVVTTSYAGAENTVSRAYANNLCNMYAQASARGISLLFASGDGGVGHGNCTNFIPTFPNHCPFVTAVGATTGFGPETAASLSSGGFSNYFPTPSYQSAAVSKFLSAFGNTEYNGLYNRSGRGFPDVSAQGIRVEYVWQGGNWLFSGTSVSSPIFAAIIALLNDELIAAGKPVLGFLNPLLYSTAASTFTDITTGNNPGCGTDGFPAIAGWDPLTGLGTPNFGKLRAAVGL